MANGGGAVLDDAAVGSALARSHFRDLPMDAVTALVEGARRIGVPAGSSVREVGEDGPHLELVIDGFVRIFVTAPDGRSLTVRYLRSGELSGVVSLFTPQFSMPGSVQAVVDSDLLSFDPRVVTDLSEHNLLVARALIHELSERVVTFVTEIPGSAFSTVRQRVARHLLDLASEHQPAGRLVARVSQQALADATGSVREVVVRVLRDLRTEDVIRTSRTEIEILRPERLIADLFATGTSARGVPDRHLV